MERESIKVFEGKKLIQHFLSVKEKIYAYAQITALIA
jgi:hypothetical protein